MKKATKLNKIQKTQLETPKNKWGIKLRRFNSMKNFKYLMSFMVIISLFSCGEKKRGNDSIASNSKQLTSFSIITPAVSGVINESAKTVSVTVPTGTDKTNLIASFETTGVKTTINGIEQESSETSNNFTNPITYTVHAENGSTVNYTVTIVVAASSDKSITFFSINGINATINETLKTIALTVPHNTNVTSMIATFSTSGTNVKVGSIVQISEETSNNFTNPVIYRVTASDLSYQEYTVTVTIAESVTTYVIIRNMTSFPDPDFFYLLEAGKELWYYKDKVLTKAANTYTETTSTYVDGVFVSSVTSAPIVYTFTDFFSIGTGTSKVLYFTINSKNYKQQSGVVTEITDLPTRPVKDRVVGSTLSFLVQNNPSGVLFSRALGKPNDLNNKFETDIITDYIETYGPNGSGWQTTKCLFVNVSANDLIDITLGLYYLPKQTNSGISGIMIKAGKGEMW